MTALMTRNELAKLLNVSTRTVDRWRAKGLDLGEFRAHPEALPRFDPEKVRQAIASSRFAKAKQKAAKTKAIPKEPCVTHAETSQREHEALLTGIAG